MLFSKNIEDIKKYRSMMVIPINKNIKQIQFLSKIINSGMNKHNQSPNQNLNNLNPIEKS